MSLRFVGTMRAHTDWVTAIATPLDSSDTIVSSSRDKSLIVWNLTKGTPYGVPHRHLTGHSHYVQDVALSPDSKFACSASWDTELRLWDLQTPDATSIRFVGHTKDVVSVAFSPDNTHIVSASRDNTIKVWNMLGECLHTMCDHTDWVSCVRFSPDMTTIVSGSWDKSVKVWKENKVHETFTGHKGYVEGLAVSPDGSLCVSGGKEGVVLMWNLEKGEKIECEFVAGEIVHAMCFSPNRYLLCVATETSIRIWDLESKGIVDVLKVDLRQESMEMDIHQGGPAKNKILYCTCLSWSADGSTLFGGYTDGVIRVWDLYEPAVVQTSGWC